jgi:hypothetical protein
MSVNVKRKIVIVGGGTAGWIAANLINRHWSELGIEVCLVESPDIGTIGVGEGSTPQMKAFFDDIRVSESQWMPACSATYKNGIRFDNWANKPGYSSYFHPFASKIDGFSAPIFMHNAGLRRRGIDIHAHPDRFYLAAYLAVQGKAPIAPENFPFDIGYGYHFDSVLLGKFLCELGISRGVKHHEGLVEHVSQHPNGDINTVRLADGQLIEADFFIDCTGFSALLIGKTLNVPFISFKENLFNDSAVAIQSAIPEKTPSQTVSTAMKYGWAWDIPLTNRTGNGYVYSSDFCSADQAEKELREKLGLLDSDVGSKHLKMRVGRMSKHWEKNVLAVGLSQGFIEPLEATALHFVIETVNSFMKSYGAAGFTNKHQDSFNQGLNARFEGIRDYIVGHYRLNSRTDTEYWKANGINQKLSANLVGIINCWLSGGDLTSEIESKKLTSYYPPFSWVCMFAGYGIYPTLSDKVQSNGAAQQYDLTEVDEFIRRSAINYPQHALCLAQLNQAL